MTVEETLESADEICHFIRTPPFHFSVIGEKDRADSDFRKALERAEKNSMIDSKATILMMIGRHNLNYGNLEDADNYTYLS
jgi:hypothetical protein